MPTHQHVISSPNGHGLKHTKTAGACYSSPYPAPPTTPLHFFKVGCRKMHGQGRVRIPLKSTTTTLRGPERRVMSSSSISRWSPSKIRTVLRPYPQPCDPAHHGDQKCRPYRDAIATNSATVGGSPYIASSVEHHNGCPQLHHRRRFSAGYSLVHICVGTPYQ